MTQQHIHDHAQLLRLLKPPTSNKMMPANRQWLMTVLVIADKIERGNKRFDRRQFYKQCGAE